MNYRDNYPNNIESPQQLYLQYSQDIVFDYSSGKYPTGLEAGFIWEDYYIPIDHSGNGVALGPHVWRREKVGLDGTWSFPQAITINSSNLSDLMSSFLETLKIESPLIIEDEILKHLNTEGNKHIPSGGLNGQALIKDQGGYNWASIITNNVLDNYYTKSELNSGQLNNLYYTETEIDSLLSDVYTSVELDLGALDNRYYTKIQLDGGQLDTRYYTESELDSGALDIRYYTETELSVNSSAEVHWDNLTNVPTMLHDDTSSINDITENNFNVITGLTFDTYGHTLTNNILNLATNTKNLNGDLGIIIIERHAGTETNVPYNPFTSLTDALDIKLNFNDLNSDSGSNNNAARNDHIHDLTYFKLTDSAKALNVSAPASASNVGTFRYREDISSCTIFIEVSMKKSDGSFEWFVLESRAIDGCVPS